MAATMIGWRGSTPRSVHCGPPHACLLLWRTPRAPRRCGPRQRGRDWRPEGLAVLADFKLGRCSRWEGWGFDLRPVGWLSRNGVITPLWRAATALASLSGGTQNREYESWLRARANHP